MKYEVSCDSCGHIVEVEKRELDTDYDLLDNLFVEPNIAYCPVCQRMTDVMFLRRMEEDCLGIFDDD